MKTHIFKLLLVVFIFQLSSCKEETKLPEFKYADQPVTINCNADLDALLKEAVYSFENDIIVKYDSNGKNLYRAYRSFLGEATYNRAKYETIVSEHSKQLFEALKTKSQLWDLENPVSKVNYNSNVIECIAKNMKESDLKVTFNSLTSVGSMSPQLFGAPLRSANITNDKYICTYIALEFYYANLFNIDLSTIKPLEEANKNDTTIKPENLPAKEDPHAGHNHD